MSSADSLSPASRVLFENTRKKMFASIFAASMGLMCLGYVSVYGGQSDSASNTAQAMAGNHDDSQWAAQVSLSGGFGESDLIALFSSILQFYMCSAPGFGAFVFFVAFATFITAAVYISPMYCGSQNEKKMINGPQEIAMESKSLCYQRRAQCCSGD
jgi:hypothetical protein